MPVMNALVDPLRRSARVADDQRRVHASSIAASGAAWNSTCRRCSSVEISDPCASVKAPLSPRWISSTACGTRQRWDRSRARANPVPRWPDPAAQSPRSQSHAPETMTRRAVSLSCRVPWNRTSTFGSSHEVGRIGTSIATPLPPTASISVHVLLSGDCQDSSTAKEATYSSAGNDATVLPVWNRGGNGSRSPTGTVRKTSAHHPPDTEAGRSPRSGGSTKYVYDALSSGHSELV